jgi:3-methyladenine DNA glycosylase AlkD
VLEELRSELHKLASPRRAQASAWFFKTGPGQYGEGDRFIGVTVPEQRSLAKRYKDLSLADTKSLLHSKIHEERLLALFILVGQFEKADQTRRKKIYDFYLSNTKFVNNWDLVDSSAPYIVGSYLDEKPKDILRKLALSSSVWERRIAMVSTGYYINKGEAELALEIAEILLQDKHDLIQKAVGWMLREIGKKCGREVLESYLNKYSPIMPRTMLRYAIEHFPAEKRQNYLARISR